MAGQQLHPDEPIHVDAVHRQMNPVRMLYRTPWDKLYKHFLRPTFGTYYGTLFRIWGSRIILWYFLVNCVYYWYKYENKNWQRRIGLIAYPSVKSHPLYKEYEEGDLLLAFRRPEIYNYFDPNFVHRIQSFDVGETKRPW